MQGGPTATTYDYLDIDPAGFGAQFGYYTVDTQSIYGGLVRVGHRYYDALYGRFLTRDPSGYGGGLNLYAFADNNPVNESDPSGLEPGDDPVDRAIDNGWTIAGAGVGAVGGGTIGGAGGTLVLPGVGTIAGAAGLGAVGAAGGALLGHTAARAYILARHLIMNASGPGAGDGIETGPIHTSSTSASSVRPVRGLWRLNESNAERTMLHPRFGRFFKMRGKNEWWSVDNAGHGGSAFKVFAQRGRDLVWVHDAWTEPHSPYQCRASTFAGTGQLVKFASNSVGGK